MDIESVGAGAGGGFLTAVLALFGIKQRFERVDKDFERVEKEIETVEQGTVWRNTCAATHKGVDERLDRMEKKLDLLITRGK